MNLLLSQVAAKLWYVNSMRTQCSTSQASVTPLSLWHQTRSASPISSYKSNPVVPNSVGHSWSIPSHKLRLSSSHYSQAFWDLQTKQIHVTYMRIILHRFMNLNIWSPVSGTVCEDNGPFKRWGFAGGRKDITQGGSEDLWLNSTS